MQEEQRELPGHRKRPLLAATLLFPLVVLLALELGLRAIGFGGSYPLFVAAEDMPDHLEANPRVIQRYFARAPELRIDSIYFKEQKPANGYRHSLLINDK